MVFVVAICLTFDTCTFTASTAIALNVFSVHSCALSHFVKSRRIIFTASSFISFCSVAERIFYFCTEHFSVEVHSIDTQIEDDNGVEDGLKRKCLNGLIITIVS